MNPVPTATASVGLIARLRRLINWRNARRTLFGAAFLATLFAAFHVVENFRGRQAWAKTRALAKAKGYTIPRTFAELAPPAVRPEDNAAEAPVLRVFYPSDTPAAKAALARWKVEKTEDITPTLLAREAGSLAELAEAVRRPHLRVPVTFEKGFDLFQQPLSAFLDAARLLAARASLRLGQSEVAAAAQDVETLLLLSALLDDDGFLLPHLVTGSISKQATGIVAEGLEANAWSAPQRARLTALLARIDLLTGMHKAIFTEWGACSVFLEPRSDLGELVPALGRTPNMLNWLLPSGWLDQARALSGRIYIESIIPSVDLTTRRIDLPRLQQVSREIDGKRRNFAFGHAVVGVIFPAYDKIVVTMAENQTRLDHARIALALADWRETHGTYPATLAELPASTGIANLHDLLSGQPYAYRPAADRSSYRLYAFGPDGQDDGGRPPANQKQATKDWVWPTTGQMR